jgi:hypothetical protein
MGHDITKSLTNGYDTLNRLVGASQDGTPVFSATCDYRTRPLPVSSSSVA